jgi:hypothetical protein
MFQLVLQKLMDRLRAKQLRELLRSLDTTALHLGSSVVQN